MCLHIGNNNIPSGFIWAFCCAFTGMVSSKIVHFISFFSANARIEERRVKDRDAPLMTKLHKTDNATKRLGVRRYLKSFVMASYTAKPGFPRML